MKAFRYLRPDSLDQAARAHAAGGVELKAGGTDLLDRMKERVDTPDAVLALLDADDDAARTITRVDGSLRIGALCTLSQIAESKDVRAALPALVEATLDAASFQIRNRATLGGNLAQHTRCGYYRHASFPCMKRGDAQCPVLEDGAVQDTAGVFGNGACASAHPSSLAPVLAAAGAVLTLRTGDKKTPERSVAVADFYQPPQRGRASDTVLQPGQVIAAVTFAADGPGAATGYAEVRQKQALDWALASCAVRLTRAADGKLGARVWLGSVAPTPHRSAEAEAVLATGSVDAGLAAKAGAAASATATPLAGNRYKLNLIDVVVSRAALAAAGRLR